jgi:hypothetical protein
MTQVKHRGDCIGAPRTGLHAGAVSAHFPACFRRPAASRDGASSRAAQPPKGDVEHASG